MTACRHYHHNHESRFGSLRKRPLFAIWITFVVCLLLVQASALPAENVQEHLEEHDHFYHDETLVDATTNTIHENSLTNNQELVIENEQDEENLVEFEDEEINYYYDDDDNDNGDNDEFLEGEEEEPMPEDERLEGYYERNYTWPFTSTTPNTKGWKRNMIRRGLQVGSVEDLDDRYNGWINVVTSGIVVPNFTENGWGLTRAPPELVQELKDSLHNGLATAREEEYDAIFQDADTPLFIDQHELNVKVLKALHPMHEEWAGVPLIGNNAYGLRVYRNDSILLMHLDNFETHIISCILHIDHSEDSKPWPIFIEDFQGNTNEVYLESGDLLFYESSKCVHGRPRRFKGSWYSSIFVHYYPVEWDVATMNREKHYAVPPHWVTQSPHNPGLEELTIVDISMIEPDCPEGWCGTVGTVKWYGPAKEGVVITNGYSEAGTDEL